MVAAGLAALGRNEWGARFGLGLAFAATALLVHGNLRLIVCEPVP